MQGEARFEGRGTQEGEAAAWTGTFAPSGAFHTATRSAYASHRAAWSGRGSDCAWDEDAAGLVRALQLDDHETLVLENAVRSSFFLRAAAAHHIEFLSAYAVLGDAATPAVDAAGLRLPAGTATVDVLMMLRGGRCVAMVSVEPSSWCVTSVQQRSGGAIERWEYSDWRLWPAAAAGASERDAGGAGKSDAGGAAFWFPARRQHLLAGDTVEEMAVTSASVSPAGSAASFQRPPRPVWPPGAQPLLCLPSVLFLCALFHRAQCLS